MQNEQSHPNVFPLHLASNKMESLCVRIAEKNKEIPLELPIYGTFVSMVSRC